jgi:serine/threonine-protein kinase
VVTVFTVEETEDSCCIVMEYLGGGSLAQRFQAGQAPPDLATVLSVLMGVLEGLQAAHTLGIVHRDLKPENILFDGLGAPRISDFGVAVLSRAAGGGNDAGTDGVAGTPLYMAPEQFDRRRNVDPRADLYAIGLIFYELVTGRRIVDLLRIERLPAKDELLALPARLPRDLLDARLNQPLKQALLQLLAADPERRMTSAGELLDLFRAQAGALGLRPDLPCWQRTPGGVTSRADVLRDVIELLLADGIMGPGERAELQRRAERLGVDESTARELEEQVRAARGLPTLAAIEVFTRLAARVLGRGSPAPAAVARLAARGRELGIAPEEQEFIAAGLRRGRGPT